MKLNIFLSSIFIFTLFTGCSTSIGNLQKLNSVEFIIGETYKMDVLNTLGLPAIMKKDEDTMQESWAYLNKTILHARIFPIISMGASGQVTSSSSRTNYYKRSDVYFDDADLVYVFDENDILVNTYRP